MLTESVSDPRRANWLTITSMSDDVCWPEEPSTSRPNWELEAEILRLTTRLMMRERELRQVKSQLKAQAAKTQQQSVSWRTRMEEKEVQVKELLVQKDAEMQNIVSQLLLFEAELRREQARIEGLLSEKDAQIASQQKEIERLRRSVDSSSSVMSNESAFSSFLGEKDAQISSQQKENERFRRCGESKTNSSSVMSSESGFGSFLSDAQIVAQQKEIERLRRSVDAKTDTSSMVSSDSAFSSFEKDMSQQKEIERFRRGVETKTDSVMSSDSAFSSLDIGESKDRARDVRIYEDVLSLDSQHAVQKLKDGLVKIRAIQDVTNVKPLEPCYESERKRFSYRAPQKMKDLKAKRINTHKVHHRPVISEMTAQAIL